MTTAELIQGSFKNAHRILLQTIADTSETSLKNVPAGANILPLQAVLAHLVTAEDGIVNGMVARRQRVTTPALLEGTGVPAPTAPNLTAEWAASIDMNLPAFIEYAKKVFASTEEAIGSLTDEQLAAEMDGPFGKRTVAAYALDLALYHLVGHSGEIAALKGIHGQKGLPF
ncbi:MAG: DinB family protein [Dehalococcoidia bacterium]